MSSRCRNCFPLAILALSMVASAQARDLRVCADPDNLPFSNSRQQGFENRIAELVASDLGAKLTYVWQRMGRGFVREYMDKSVCDVLIGIPSNYRPVLTTTPYYRSTYVFVTRREARVRASSFDDPGLRLWKKIGVQVLDEDYTPPGAALVRRGLQNAIVGFDTTGDDAGEIISAVANRKIDAAIVWGPLAGYFAKTYRDRLALQPVTPEVDPPGLPFTFSISMGVRKGNVALRDELEMVLVKRSADIEKVLNDYGVPQLTLPPRSAEGN
jgi:mxaJ protein